MTSGGATLVAAFALATALATGLGEIERYGVTGPFFDSIGAARDAFRAEPA